MHEFHLAYVCHVNGSLLYHQIPTQIWPQQDTQVHASQNRLRLAHLVSHLIAHARSGLSRSQQCFQFHNSHLLAKPSRIQSIRLRVRLLHSICYNHGDLFVYDAFAQEAHA